MSTEPGSQFGHPLRRPTVAGLLVKDIEWMLFLAFPLMLLFFWLFTLTAPQNEYLDQLQSVIVYAALLLAPLSVLGYAWRYRRARSLALNGEFFAGRVVGFTVIARSNYAICEYLVGGITYERKEVLWGSGPLERAEELMMQELALFVDTTNPSISVLMTKLQ